MRPRSGEQKTGAIPASRCVCGKVTAPPVRFCPRCAREMSPTSLPNVGELLSYTILFRPPEGFSGPLPIALVELAEGAKFLCHGHEAEIEELKIGRQVQLEAVDGVYFFSTLSFGERVRLFWRRRSQLHEKLRAIGKSLARFRSSR